MRFSVIMATVVSLISLFSTLTVAAPSERSIDSLVKTLTLRQKIGQMVLVYHSPYKFLAEHGVGGVLIMQNMVGQSRNLAVELDTIQKRLPIPLLVTMDQEGGTVNRISSMPAFKKTPSAQELARLDDDSIYNYGRRSGLALRKIAINMNLAPVLDPEKNHRGALTYIAQKSRSFGNGDAIQRPAAQFIKGFASCDVGCIAKHFPGYDVETNSDLALAKSDADSETIERYIEPFGSLMPELSGVMMSSIQYAKISPLPAVLSPEIVQWARKIAGDKIIMTDDLWGTALRAYTYPGRQIHPVQYPDSAFGRLVSLSVKAGNDVLMITYPEKVAIIISVIEKLAASEPQVAQHIEAAVRRILKTKMHLGLLTLPARS